MLDFSEAGGRQRVRARVSVQGGELPVSGHSKWSQIKRAKGANDVEARPALHQARP